MTRDSTDALRKCDNKSIDFCIRKNDAFHPKMVFCREQSHLLKGIQWIMERVIFCSAETFNSHTNSLVVSYDAKMRRRASFTDVGASV